MWAANDKLTIIFASEHIKVALYKNLPATVDAEINVGDERLMFREKSAKWVVPYLVIHNDGKILMLDTGNQSIRPNR